MVRKTALFLFLWGTFFNAYADDTQELRKIYNNYLPDFQKMTPEASALGQYGKYNSSGYTGVPSISVPLFSIGSGSFSMPVELCYDASGIKVDQQATYVGLGWNLIMGGSISQIVCGKNDFYESVNSSYSNLDLLQAVLPGMGCHPSYGITAYPSVGYPAKPLGSSTCLPVEEDRMKYYILQDVENGARVPDIFQASFCGHSVSFIIETTQDNSMARIIGNDATAYKIDLMDYAGSYPLSIEITDDHGLKYVFTAAPKTSMEDNASYNLSEIKNAAGQCLAEFTYTEVSHTLLQSYYETEGKRDENSDQPIASEAINNLFINLNYPGTLSYNIKEYYPNTIITDKETVTFTYGTREDIKSAKRIDKITVTSNNDQSTILHTAIFNYGNFTENGNETELCSRYRYTNAYGYKRLKLTDVTVDGKKYSFGYESQDLPLRITRQQDFWGYYNGKNNEDGLCASPECKYDNEGNLIALDAVGPANRYASESHCKAGILNRITYPTGGYTKFYYELNHFNDVEGKYYYPSANSNAKYIRKEVCGSGYNGHGYNTTAETTEFDVSQPVQVDIASNSPYLPSISQYYNLYLSIVGKDSDGQTVFSKYYTKYNDRQDFNESCVLPKGHYVLSSQFGSVASGLMIGGAIQVSFPPEYREDLSIADVSGKSVGGGLRIKAIENYDSDNVLLGYTRYKYEDGKLLIPTVRKEHIELSYVYAPTYPNGMSAYPSSMVCSLFFITSNPAYLAICSFGCPHVGYSKVTKENYDGNGMLMSYDVEKYNNEGYYSAQDKIFNVNSDGLNGKLTESMTYSKDNVPMHKVCYTYRTIGANPALSDLVFFPWTRCLDMNPGNTALDVYYKYSLYSKSPICALPSSVTETNYGEDGGMAPVVTTYDYKESIYQPASVTRTVDYGNNTKDIHLTEYWYPDDAEVSNSNTACLTSTHCVSEQVKAKEYKNGKTVGGYRNVYTLSNGLPVVSRNCSIAPSGNEYLELIVTGYDSYGNIREYKRRDGTPVTIIWSYSHQVPVMEIVGMTYTAVKNKSNDVVRLEEATIATSIINMTESLHDVLTAEGVMATAYEYSPWYTVSCVIMPNGNKTRYSYDSYGRLEEVSDINGKKLQKYSYNYRTK